MNNFNYYFTLLHKSLHACLVHLLLHQVNIIQPFNGVNINDFNSLKFFLHIQIGYLLSRIFLMLVKSLWFTFFIIIAMIGANSLEKPVGLPLLRNVIFVALSFIALQV